MQPRHARRVAGLLAFPPGSAREGARKAAGARRPRRPSWHRAARSSASLLARVEVAVVVEAHDPLATTTTSPMRGSTRSSTAPIHPAATASSRLATVRLLAVAGAPGLDQRRDVGAGAHGQLSAAGVPAIHTTSTRSAGSIAMFASAGTSSTPWSAVTRMPTSAAPRVASRASSPSSDSSAAVQRSDSHRACARSSRAPARRGRRAIAGRRRRQCGVDPLRDAVGCGCTGHRRARSRSSPRTRSGPDRPPRARCRARWPR